MDLYIFATMMHERIINSIVSRNNDDVSYEYLNTEGFKMHFKTNNKFSYSENVQEIKRRMKEDGVASLLIYNISEI